MWTLGILKSDRTRFKLLFEEEALGVMDRLVLSDAQWDRISGLIIGRPDQRGSTGRDNRMFHPARRRMRSMPASLMVTIFPDPPC